MIIKQFETVVEASPAQIAIKTGQRGMTFRELHLASTAVAAEIVKNYKLPPGCERGGMVSLLFEHGIEMIVALLAALKADKVYVPLDRTYPKNRLQYMLEHSESYLLLTNSENHALAKSLMAGVKHNLQIFNIDKIDTCYIAEDVPRSPSADKLAYILYTSGSTGRPKGVLQSHGNVLHYIRNWQKYLSISTSDRLTFFSAFSHDAAVPDIFGSLLSGATLYPFDVREAAGIDQLAHWLVKERLTVWHSVPTLFRYFFNTLTSKERFPDIRFIILGGEAVRKGDIDAFKRFFPQSTLANIYGQTESTISSIWTYRQDETFRRVMLGNPIDETEILIVKEDGEIIEDIGVGEIFVRSEYIALEYWKDPEVSSKVFLRDNELGKLYRTGDIGRILSEGCIEFMGRMDSQIKIRGFRVEAGEIETLLLKHENIKDVVVISREDELKGVQLYAYYVPVQAQPDNSVKLSTAALREFLASELPEYMIPSFFVRLSKIPLTPGGKVDRKNLPVPECNSAGEYVAPMNELQEKLVNIWSDVLALDKKLVSVKANFFELGGDSLKTLTLRGKIQKICGVDVPLREFFKYSTIETLAGYIQGCSPASDFHSLPAVEKKDSYPLSPAQRRLYIINESADVGTTYNLPSAMMVTGVLNKDLFEKTFQRLIRRHEVLRTSFRIREGMAVQVVAEEVNFGLAHRKLAGLEFNDTDQKKLINSLTETFLQPFDIGKAPLFRAELVEFSSQNHLLLLDLHHIVADGISLGILVREFVALYRGGSLPSLKVQYKDYSEWQDSFLKSDTCAKQEDFWLEKFAGGTPVLTMPLDFPRSEKRSFVGATRLYKISAPVLKMMKHLAGRVNVTLNILIFAVYVLLVSKYSDQKDIVVGSLTAGRGHVDLENTVGMFANFLAVRVPLDPASTFEAFLAYVQKIVLEAYENQDYPFENLIDRLNAPVDLNRNTLFDTMLIFHNEIESDLKLKIEGLTFERFDYERKTAKLDFKIDVFPGNSGDMHCYLEYDVGLFSSQTMVNFIRHFDLLIKSVIEEPGKKLEDIELFTPDEKLLLGERRQGCIPSSLKSLRLVVSATFTADPIADYIRWWGRQFKLNIEVEFCAYNQVFQELIDESGLLSIQSDVNLLLVRFEDWIRDLRDSDEYKLATLERSYTDLVSLLKQKEKRCPYFVGIFPISTHLPIGSLSRQELERLNVRWRKELAEMDRVYIIDFNDMGEMYQIPEIFDALADREGHMPFNSGFYAAMGTIVARKICALYSQPFKVIVLDCDNTLWQGVCGEDGALGVRIEETYTELQQFMLQKYHQGFLLALCSKNNETDVWEVFDRNPHMILKKEHFVSWRINWLSKSVNIKDLAFELNLGIDSFILIDDSPVECVEVMTHLPQVLTLRLPSIPESIPLFLRHIWAFDRHIVTDEDRQRTQMYLADKRRRQQERESVNQESFLSGLQIKISMNVMQDAQAGRVSQLTQRTNQFNLSTIRRKEAEIDGLTKEPGVTCWVIEVSDRFGDYGLVGVIVSRLKEESLFVDTLLLSCRVLGRGVEEVLLVGLKRYCLENNLKTMTADFLPTPKNKAVLDFLNKKWLEKECFDDRVRFELQAENIPDMIEFADFYYMTPLRRERVTKPETDEFADVYLDHIAAAVTDIERTLSFYRAVGFLCGEVVHDPLQNVKVAFCQRSGFDAIELVAAVDEESPTWKIVENRGDTPYHLCFRTESGEKFLQSLQVADIPFELISDFKPAALFDGEPVMFIQVGGVGLVELHEKPPDKMEAENIAIIHHNTVRVLAAEAESPLKFYRHLGYVQAANISRGKYLEITLEKSGCGKIAVIVPRTEECREYELLEQFGPHPYQICFYENSLADITANLEEKSFAYNSTKSGAVSGNRLPTPIIAAYNLFYPRSNQAAFRPEREWQVEIANAAALNHYNHLQPLMNHTAGKLLALPVWKAVSRATVSADHEEPRNIVEKRLKDIWQLLLGVERISINTSFFQLGGNSLKAISLLSEIHKEFNVELRLKNVFDHKTIKELAKLIGHSEENIYSAIDPVSKKEYYPLSSAQKRLYILQQMELVSTAYNMFQVVVLAGTVDRESLAGTFKEMIRRHESLRTSFRLIDGEPVQIVHERVKFEIECEDTGETGNSVKDIIRAFLRPFDLTTAPLFRVGLTGSGGQRHLLMVDMHHIISDGISHEIFVQDFIALHRGRELPELRIQYKDFGEWQNREKQQAFMKRQESYWLNLFSDGVPVLNLPCDYERPLFQDFAGRTLDFQIGPDETELLNQLAVECNVTQYMVILALFNILLAKIGNQEDIVLGTPVAGRRHADLKHIIGIFVNTLVIRNYPLGHVRFCDFLEETGRVTLSAFDNQDYQFEDLVEKVSVTRDVGRNPLFDVMFVFQQMSRGFNRTYADNGEVGEIPGLKVERYPVEDVTSRVDLTLTAVESRGKGSLSLSFQYAARLFKRETVEKMTGYFKRIISSVLASPQDRLSEIEMISHRERIEILEHFNDTEVLYPAAKTIHGLFEEMAEKVPYQLAVTGSTDFQGLFREQHLTYGALERMSSHLAFRLKEKGIRSNAIAAVMLDRSVELIACIYAILRAGGAYLPIDTCYPRDRVDYMLADSGAEILIAAKAMGRRRIAEELIDSAAVADIRVALPLPGRLPASTGTGFGFSLPLAYVIYTSGTTGRPKGTLIQHRSLVNRLHWMQRKYPLDVSDTILHKTPFTFDVSVWEIFWWAITGARVHLLLAGGEKDPGLMVDAVQRYRVTVIHFVPSMLKVFLGDVAEKGDISRLSSLKQVIASGEALGVPLVKTFQTTWYRHIETKLSNLYGPTEATIDVSYFDCPLNDENLQRIPIGKPIDNTRLVVVDRCLGLMPIGAAGELCIAGVGLAMGYLNRPELTAEKFLETGRNRSRAVQKGGERLYRTGDLARFQSDGNIEFLGRLDQQVKLRGYRIELEEIETLLAMYPGVGEALVCARTMKNGDDFLCAYYVSRQELEVSRLREYLAKNLPEYMIPSFFIPLEKIPLTPNGKRDRRALPDPRISVTDTQLEPVKGIEKKLVDIWADILDVEKEMIGLDSNFFQLGGHSLKAVVMTTCLHRQLNVKVELKRVFQLPTVRGLAAYIEGLSESIYEEIKQVEKREYYPQSSAQKRLFFLEQFENIETSYNMPAVHKIVGPLECDRLGSAFSELISRHETLRTSFELVNNEAVQRVHDTVAFEIGYIGSGDIESYILPFDLSIPPLLRVRLLSRGETEHLLLVDMHHIISDGTSRQILVREFVKVFNGGTLPSLRIQYRDFAYWQNRLYSTGEIERQQDYWLTIYGNSTGIPRLQLPTDNPRPEILSFQGARFHFKLGREETGNLRRSSTRYDATPSMNLMAAFYVLLYKYTGQNDIVIGFTIAGRPHGDLQDVIGMFVNKLAIRNNPVGNQTYSAFLKAVRTSCINAFENQDLQFEELVNLLALERDPSRNPLFDVSFVAQTFERAAERPRGISIEPFAYEGNTTKFDITLFVMEGEDEIGFTIEYAAALFKRMTIEKMAERYIEILRQVMEDEHIKLDDIRLYHTLAEVDSTVPRIQFGF